MYPYHLSNNSNVCCISEKKDIKNETDDKVSGNSCYQDKYANKNLDTYHSTGIELKDKLPCNFLNTHTYCELYQNDNYEEKLLFPDVFKLDKSNSINSICDFDDNEPSTSYAVKRPRIEDAVLSTAPNPKKIYPEQRADKEKSFISPSLDFAGQIIKDPNLKNTEQLTQNHAVKKNVTLKFYRRNNLCYTKTNLSIVYRDAIKRIDVDANGLFKKFILEEMGKALKKRNFLKSHPNLSTTYHNIRKYVLGKLSKLLNEDSMDADILISPGMSISDLRSNFISNNNFLKKLRDNCEKIARDVRIASDNYLSHVFQSRIIFKTNDSLNSTNTKISIFPQKDKLIAKLKELIIDTASNLPNSVIREIEKLDQDSIVNALFSNLHGVMVSKSLIKNLNLLFNSNKNKSINGIFDDNLDLFNDLLHKIGNLVRSSCIFHEGIFSLDEPTVEQLSKYLLSDMWGISSKFHDKLKLPAHNTHKTQKLTDDVNLEYNYKKYVVTNISAKEKFQTPKSSLIFTNTALTRSVNIKKEINNDYTHDKTLATSVIKSINQPRHSVVTKEFSLGSYRRINLFSADIISPIYEDAIKKIDIDGNGLFINSVFEELGSSIISMCVTKSSLSISKTYSNVRKYILNKVSPYIRDIINYADVSITHGMYIPEINHNCISNKVFFEKFNEKCDEIVKNIHLIPNDYFLSLIQSNINLGSAGRLKITNRRNKLCSKVKFLITETISNLPNSIGHELRKFKQSEIINGLFSKVHGIHIPKSSIRKMILYFNSNELPNNASDLCFLNNLLTRLLNQITISPVLHKGKMIYIGKYTAELLSKYLLSDVYGISSKLHNKLTPRRISDSPLKGGYEKTVVANTYDDTKLPLLEKPILIPPQKSKWSPDLITSINIYELSLSMIDIDKGDFENYVIDKVSHYPLIKELLTEKEKINFDFSVTYERIKNHILEIFSPFFKEIAEETQKKVKLLHGMTVDELRHAYISNKYFFDKLCVFCNEVIDRIKNRSDSTLVDMIQCRVPLETEVSKVIWIEKSKKIRFYNGIEKILIKNISNIPRIITNVIKLLPNTKLLEGCFSHFCDMYVDNASLLKSKLVFDYIQKKVSDDHLLNRLVDTISTDMINKIEKGNITSKIINSHMVYENLSTYNYIRKLVREKLPALKDKISDPIMIVRNDKIEIADQKTRDTIFDKLKSYLIETTIKSYRDLCIKKYRLYNSKMKSKKLIWENY